LLGSAGIGGAADVTVVFGAAFFATTAWPAGGVAFGALWCVAGEDAFCSERLLLLLVLSLPDDEELCAALSWHNSASISIASRTDFPSDAFVVPCGLSCVGGATVAAEEFGQNLALCPVAPQVSHWLLIGSQVETWLDSSLGASFQLENAAVARLVGVMVVVVVVVVILVFFDGGAAKESFCFSIKSAGEDAGTLRLSPLLTGATAGADCGFDVQDGGFFCPKSGDVHCGFADQG
jgi:hypothetical protein